MVMTTARRAKRIIRWLSSSQEDDLVLTPSVTPLIRYNLLHNYQRCAQVSVKLANHPDQDPPTLSYHEMPKFLRSQLEAQKIADGTNLWAQIEPVLAFIEANLPRSRRSRGFPTLFLWYSRENHRSYIFFAFIQVSMASKTYTARELLRMRHVPAGRELYDQLYNKLRRDLELSDIVRVQPERSLSLIKEESRDASTDSDDCLPSKPAPVRQLDGTDSEWKYRGRTDSENGQHQPISAPSGLAAQKDEGFRRFYRAVVSPTHVRVTAGGRIVPNTRGSTSPTGKWSKERISSDGASPSRPPSRDQPEPAQFSVPPAGFGPLAPAFPGFAPGMPPGMPAGPAPFPLMPWHMGINMGGFGVAHPHWSHASAPRSSSPKKTNGSSRGEKQSDGCATENEPRVRISPPEHFDQARPFFYNGQWMMPPSGPFYPYGMPPLPGFAAPPMAGPPPMVHPQMAGNPTFHPQEPKSGRSAQSPVPNAPSSSGSSAPSFAPASNPPISSIRPSEITKKQIEVLRGSLRYLEDQLQYNKHQIDEKATEHQGRLVRQQIQQFEKNLEVQLGVEEGRYPRNERKGEMSSSASSQGIMRSKSSFTSETNPDSSNYDNSTSQVQHAPVSSSKAKLNRDRGPTRFSSGINPAKSASAFATAPSASEPPNHASSPTKASGLPFNAALAPPFQPRSNTATPVHAVSYSAEHYVAPGSAGEAGQTHVDSELAKAGLYNASSSCDPYLVGRLPHGINPELVRDTDYIYDRGLTEDELRARHMYWGKAPRHLQKGLPKFDGRDFYPPSPTKGSSEDPSSSMLSAHLATSEEGPVESGLNKTKTGAGPFRSFPRLSGQRVARAGLGDSTQSESLPRSGHPVPGLPMQRTETVGGTYEDFRKAMSEAANASSDNGKGKSSSDEGDDDRNLIFKGRRAMCRNGTTKTHNDIWQSMLKKGKSSANAVPVTISSMTARGVLPNYAGHAAASLTPTVANSSAPQRSSTAKPGEAPDAGPTAPVAEKMGENRPPADVSLNESLRGLSVRDAGRKGLSSR